MKFTLEAIAASCVLACLPLAAPADATTSVSSRTPPGYTDIAGNFAANDILELTRAGVLHGYPNGAFQPGQYVTRGQFLAYLMNELRPYTGIVPHPLGPYYTDVPPGNWDYNTVGAAQAAGWINRYWLNVRPGGLFNENYEASRGDAAAMFVAAMQNAAPALHLPVGLSPLSYAQAAGIFTGVPNTPSGVYLTRADAAVVLANIRSWLRSPLLRSGLTHSIGGSPQAQSAQQSSQAGASQATAYQAAASQAGGPLPVVLGWNFGGTVSSYLSQDAAANQVNTFVYDGFRLNASGQFVGAPGTAYADGIAALHGRAWALFGNGMLPALTHQFISTPASRQSLASQMASLCKTDHFQGANIDFENVNPSDRANFTAFVQTAAQTLHSDGLTLSVDVAPPSAGSWAAAYDYGKIAAASDYVAVMTYDQHWSGDLSPGPVSSLSWVRQNVAALLPDIPKSKFLLGIPLYTRAWDVASPSQSQSMPVSQMSQLIQDGKITATSRDPASGQEIDQFTGANGAVWEFWQDGPNTLHSIAAIASDDGLAGVAFWQLGYQTPEQLQAIVP